MTLSAVLDVDCIFLDVRANSKKQVLQYLAEKAADQIGIEERAIFEKLVAREKLGSTGVGNGVAIPHGKLSELKRIYGVFARLAEPVEFESLDDQPVDLVFLLLAPEDAGAEHLKTLAKVARVLRENDRLDELRSLGSRNAILMTLTEQAKSDAA